MARAASPIALFILLLGLLASPAEGALAATEPGCDAACASVVQAQPDVSSLLQVGLASVATRRTAPEPAPSPPEPSIVHCMDPTGYLDVGPIYTAEQKSFLVWEHQPGNSGPDGGGALGCNNSHPEDLDKPIVEVVANLSAGEDGYCHFGFFPGVVNSVRHKTWIPVAVAQTYYLLHAHAMAETKLDCPEGYNISYVMSTPGASIVEVEQCSAMGFLDFPVELLWNFAAVNERAAQQCQELLQEFSGEMGNFTMRRLQDQFTGPRMGVGENSVEDWRRHYAMKCALWQPYGLASDLAWCRYNFCNLADGRVGAGLQCRPDWLNEYDVAEYLVQPVHSA